MLPQSVSELAPQHWGMLAGLLVFWLTVMVVGVLLVRGGSIQRIQEQSRTYETAGPAALQQQLQPRPLLYDELLEAARTLPMKPAVPATLSGALVELTGFDPARDTRQLHEVSNGAPTLSLAYDPKPLWQSLGEGPYQDEAAFRQATILQDVSDGARFIVVDKELGKIIGMASVLDNRPSCLRARIGDIWIAPNYGTSSEQRQQALQEAAYLLVRHLFGLRYRRIEWQMEPGHVDSAPAGQLGFTLEGILRKHQIVQDRSRDTAVFSITNGDWRDGGQEHAETVLYGAPESHSKATLLSQSSSQQQARSVEKKKAK